MGRYYGPKHKLSRRFGVDIFGSGGQALQRRLNVPPGGVPKGRRRKRSQYAEQLLETQKLRHTYGVRSGQLRRYFRNASRGTEPPGPKLLSTLERRLDNVVYRLGWARTRPMARQLVNHGHVLVDGRPVDIPSYQVRQGQRIELDEKARRIPDVIELLEGAAPAPPAWLRRDGPSGVVDTLPQAEDAEPFINIGHVVEYFAR